MTETEARDASEVEATEAKPKRERRYSHAARLRRLAEERWGGEVVLDAEDEWL